MKSIVLTSLLLATAALGLASDSAKTWNGRTRGMELVTIGHKRITVFLADGRAVVLGIPILVERPNSTRK